MKSAETRNYPAATAFSFIVPFKKAILVKELFLTRPKQFLHILNKTTKLHTGLDLKVTRTHWKFLVELVGEQRVRELSKIELTEGAHRVDVLDIRFFCQVGDMFRVKFMASKESRGKQYFKGKARIGLQKRKQRPKVLTSTSVNEYFLKWLHLDFSSNWMFHPKTSAFVCGNQGQSFNIKMDSNLWNADERAAYCADLKTGLIIPNGLNIWYFGN